MLLSIVIPMYNAEKYIQQCLNSVINQNISKEIYEIIVIDDGSTDESYNKAKIIADDHSNIYLYKQNNKGVSRTRNRGMQLATGAYINFIDSDDFILHNKLNNLVLFSLENNLDILEYKLTSTVSRNVIESELSKINESNLNITTGEKYLSERFFHDSSCVYLIRKEFLIKSGVKFHDGRIMEDMIFVADLISKAKRIVYYPLDVYRYVRNANSIWTSLDRVHLRNSIKDFIFMIFEYSRLIADMDRLNIPTVVLRRKRETMIYNLIKRIVKSDYNRFEINKIYEVLSTQSLYPVKDSSQNYLRKNLIHIFNNPRLFYSIIFIYKPLKGSINYFIENK